MKAEIQGFQTVQKSAKTGSWSESYDRFELGRFRIVTFLGNDVFARKSINFHIDSLNSVQNSWYDGFGTMDKNHGTIKGTIVPIVPQKKTMGTKKA